MPNPSPNMGLPIPIIGQDSGLVWEQSIQSALNIIDQHMHSSGSGVVVTPSGLYINTNLPMNGNSLTTTGSIVFSPLMTPSSTIGSLYESGVDLWYTDGNGNQIQMTSGGAVLATSSGIVSGSASASFVAGVLVVNALANTPANIQVASVLFGNNTSGSYFATVSPPSALGANYNLTLPAIPSTLSFMTLDTSGNMGTASSVAGSQIEAGTITGAQIANNTIAPINQTTQNTSSSSFQGSNGTTSSSPTAMSGVTCTITVSGQRGVLVGLRGEPSQPGGDLRMLAMTESGTPTIYGLYSIYRDGVAITTVSLGLIAPIGGGTPQMQVPANTLWCQDFPSAGSHTYAVYAWCGADCAEVFVENVYLVATEM